MRNVIVIGKNFSSVLGAARSLGEAGYGVRLLALTRSAAEVAGHSKYINKTKFVKFDFFEESTAEEELKAIEELADKEEKTLIIPCRDITCLMLEKNWKRLSDCFYFPNIKGTPGLLAAFSDKSEQKKLAAECGILTATGKIYSTDEQGIIKAISETVFPCFIKPLSSSWAKDEKNYLHACHDSIELGESMKKAASEGMCKQILIEKKLEIEKELSLYGVSMNGQVYIPAIVETVRDGLGSHRGVAAEGRIVPSDILGNLKEKLELFVKRSGLNGLFCIDLAQCEDGIYFLEMNLRMGGSCYGVTKAGANLPAALADMVYNGKVSGTCTVKENIEFISELVDFDSWLKELISLRQLIMYLKVKKMPFIRSKSDPKPWLYLVRNYLRRKLIKAANKVIPHN